MSQEDIYLQSYPFTTAAAIIGFVDRKVSAILVDGRTIIGVLRTFDQFGNLVIHDGIERIYLKELKQYAESSKSQIYVIRGENLLMIGDLDIDYEDNAITGYEKIDYVDAYTTFKNNLKLDKLKSKEKSKLIINKGAFVGGYNTPL
jgi:U6 snRNA-associated Sm-like protein LSm1